LHSHWRGQLFTSNFDFALAPGRETCLNLNNLLHCYKKDLTGIAFALKMARGTPSLLHFAFALAPPRRKSQVLQIDQLNLQ